MLRRFLTVTLTLVAILAAGWLSLRRSDISYDTLETAYSVEKTKFLTLTNGSKIHYTDTGPRDKPVIVLVHGFAASLHTWTAWVDDLENDFRVITLDLPGHGLSRVSEPKDTSIELFAEIVHSVTRALGVEKFTIVGNSMGGNTAWSYALAYPGTLEGLVLVDASGWPKSEADQKETPFAFRIMSYAWVRAIAKDLDLSMVVKSGLQDSYTDQSFVTEDLVERYLSLTRAPGHRETLINLLANRDSRVEATPNDLARISVPTLILWGEDDKLIPVGDAQKFQSAISGSKAIIYPGVGHFPQEEAAQESLADLREFMQMVEFNALGEELIIPAGDPTLVSKRPTAEMGGQ